ncbi:hypothetical protein CDL15_Pgr023011 [Punica granatum]|nr:hypothetical protein CDL15_Pgr023011 [Punica granatum]
MEKTMKKKEAVVLYPSPLIGHVISMVELGRLILSHRPSAAIHVLVSTAPSPAATAATADYISSVSASAGSSISFHHLPATTLPPTFSTMKSNLPTVALALELLRLDAPNVHSALESLSKHHLVLALVIDFFCASAVPVAKELGIPCHCFFTSGAGGLTHFLYLPYLHKNITKSFKDLDPDFIIDIPGTPLLVPSDLPNTVLDRGDRAYEIFLESSMNIQRADGAIVNTFEELQPLATRALVEGQCTPGGTTPPLYCIGPLISNHDAGDNNVDKGSLKWLDMQPSKSVVFLCFGSMGVFPKEQLKEMAIGLERSGQRFLWVVRNPPDQPDSDFDSLFPDRLLERTKGRGLMVHRWAPQVAVLNHGSVGGFVTHCGWNSVLESVCAGVPMIAWPLYAEQPLQRALMVKEMKIALSMNASRDGIVSAAEVEERVRELMDSEAGKSVREKTLAMKEAARAALSLGGSSRVALTRLVDSWIPAA